MKLLQLLSLLCIMFIVLGTVLTPNNPAFWLATNATVYQLARLGLSLVLIIQFFTQPPRQVWFRLLAGLLAIGTTGWVIAQVLAYHMGLLDMLAFLSAACTILATSLERRPEESLQRTSRNVKAA